MTLLNIAKFQHKASMDARLKWIIALIGLWSFVWSVQLFIAGNAYYSVKNSIDVWQRKPELVNALKVDRALGKIEIALSYFPKNALYYQMQGQLYEWKAFSVEDEAVPSDVQTVPSNSPENLNQAFVAYKKSLELRPNWSGSWIGLASVKWKRRELDSAFYAYLARAVEVGPQDAIVHKFVVAYGLDMFVARSLHYVEVKDLLKRHLDAGIQNPLSRSFVLQAIQQHNVTETVCRWLNDSSYSVRKRIPNCVTYN